MIAPGLPRLEARIDRQADGSVRVLSPSVGWWTLHPVEGQVLVPGACIGLLQKLNHRYCLVLPEGGAGRVEEVSASRTKAPVGYGEPLLTLSSADGLRWADTGADAREGAQGGRRGPTIVAPSDGVFYRRASPDAAAYVEVGTRVHPGQTVGLVEVMKTFNQIVYAGDAEATVEELPVADGAEVRAGQVLVVLTS